MTFKAIMPRHGIKPVLVLAWLSAVLLGCGTTAPAVIENTDWVAHRQQMEALDSWQLQGRVNVRYDNESHTPRIRWMQQSLEYHIRLWGTFNAGNTTIIGRPGFVILEQGNQTRRAASAEDLILQQLGYELPVSNLNYWIKGLPVPALESTQEFNELNLLSTLVQDGWTIHYSDYRQYQQLSLPGEIELLRTENDIRLRFLRLSWALEDAVN